eukprot:3306010-Ditylum_brightwellii.AAC.1
MYSTYYDALYKGQYVQQDEMQQPLVFLCQLDPGTMHYHQAMKEPDWVQFIEAIVREINTYNNKRHWKLIPKDQVLEGVKILSAVWAMKLLLILNLLNNWSIRQIDFVSAYPQAPIKCNVYRALSAGIVMKDGTSKMHVLTLEKKLYGQKEAVQAIANLKEAELDIEDQGDLKDYLGINISKVGDKIKLSQPCIINQIQCQVGLDPRKRHKSTMAPSTKILRRDQKAPTFDKQFHYHSVIGKVNYLEKSTCLDIAYAAHQCTQFAEDLHSIHAKAVEYLASYLAGTRELGVLLSPDKDQSFEVYADVNFIDNCHNGTVAEDPSTVKSQSGYVVCYAG